MSLTTRSFVGLANMLVLMGAVLFLSAWSLTYWQGWVFLIVFAIATTLITIYFLRSDPELIQRRLQAGPVAEHETSQKIIQTFASVFFLALVAFPAFDHRFGWSHLPPYVVLAGDVFVVLGLYFVFLVFKENSFASATIEVGKEQPVISTGPYRLVRHPMYAGAFLMLLGIPLALGSLWGILFCAPIFAVIVWRLIEEEKFLSTNLAGYREYCAKTRYRLIPGIY